MGRRKSGFFLKLYAPSKYIFKIRFMLQSNKNSIDFSKDDLFAVNLKIEKCQLYILKDVVIKTLGEAGRLVEIGGVGSRTPEDTLGVSVKSKSFFFLLVRSLYTAGAFLGPFKVLWRTAVFSGGYPPLSTCETFCEPAVLYPFCLTAFHG